MISLKPWLSKQSIWFAPVVMISGALALVLLIGCWGMVRDLRSVRDSVTSSEVAQIRSLAERTVHRIENELAQPGSLLEFVSEPRKQWLEDYWRRTILSEPSKLYGAVVSKDGEVLAHSDSLLEDSPRSQAGDGSSTHLLPSTESGVPLTGLGEGIYLLTDRQPTGERKILDFRLPIMSGSRFRGYYRTGVEYSMLEKKIRAAQNVSMRGWLVVMAGTAVIVVFASVSLYRLGVHSFRLEKALTQAETRRLEELNQLIVGLAHEVRNPLNAIRLNLFTSEKVIRGDTHVDQSEAIAMLQESVLEIERVDGLIGQLLGYARINGSPTTCLEVEDEIRSTLQFLKGVHERQKVNVQFQLQQPGLTICMGPQCFRQILLNLLQNACQAAGPGGRVEVMAQANGPDAIVSIHDSGPGVSSSSIKKIFEPFFSTRENGVGMGLAVVKSLVENAGGQIDCRPSHHLAGTEFYLRFPIMKDSDMNGAMSHG